ncbi:sarcoplasmic/endoplasmic reticulum calcium ATPase regulator DWORF isoform X2 [Podarcis muralis]
MEKSETILYSTYVIPPLLLLGWLAGCVLMVWYVFS